MGETIIMTPHFVTFTYDGVTSTHVVMGYNHEHAKERFLAYIESEVQLVSVIEVW